MAQHIIRSSIALTEFVKKVRQKLEEKDMSLYTLAEAAHVGRPYLHRVLAGQQTPTIEWMERVGNVLDIQIKVVIR
jgi:predicted transcriptional regulator